MATSTQDSSRLTGYSLAILAALFWGVSGALAQFLFEHRGVTPAWLVTIRLLISGSLLLLIPFIKNPKKVFSPWRNKNDSLLLLSFGIFGMLAVQYTYFAAIKTSNAATATIIQYIGPVFIACYYSIKDRRVPLPNEALAIVMALLGTFLIVTHGKFGSLSISGEALFWGLTSALALAVYSILPIRLMKIYDAAVVAGWGMLIGGIAFSLISTPGKMPGTWDFKTYLCTAGIIIFGTALAFYSYLISVRIIGATVASLLACAEPLSAAIIGVVWLQVPFGIYDWLGTVCILITIGLLTKSGESD